MEPTMAYRRAIKRPMEENNVDDDIDKVYRFKILLPNGTSIGLTLRDPKPEMPSEEFIKLVKDEYHLAYRLSQSMKQKKPINWKSECLHLTDENDRKLRNKMNFRNLKPHKCYTLLLHDGSARTADTFENMYDLTPDTDLLMELPEEYTNETALADLIDNSLQAVWSNGKKDRRLISVDILEDRISIFDTGPGMDGSDENCIAKWGKMGASLNRSSKELAIGGKPPYLMPFFGMFGFGGLIASMHLGRRALVSSKTKESMKVHMLYFDREALCSRSGSETWQTKGGIRNPLDDEIERSPQGSFTKVLILEPKTKISDISQLQCKLKDIYFPYIQCDEVSNTGMTTTPIEFQINGADLAEIQGGEVAITNLHSCNGPEFVLQLRLSLKQVNAATKSPGSRASQEANARLKCVYFPIVEGKENIERILEILEAEGCGITENFETFSRVSIRRLGRLLPDARWACLPFMEFRQKRGDKADLLKRCGLRVKCFIDTDAGFNPTPSKTDLAQHNPFTISLKNFGNKPLEKEKDIDVEIYRAGKMVTPLQLEREYQDWLLQMHDLYDKEIDSGEDQPVIVVSPKNKKALGISTDVVRVHRILQRKGVSWKCGQRIKVLKGACAGFRKNNVYATLEYFLIEGFQGDAGGEARIICRELGIPKENGAILEVNDVNASLDIRSSSSLPISVIDSGKCQHIDSIEWDYHLEKQRQKAPSTIDLLNAKDCQELDVDGALPDATIHAGQAPPKEIVAVVRPASFISSNASKKLDQKYIMKDDLEMSMEVKFRGEAQDLQDVHHIYSGRIAPSPRNGLLGLYIFPLGCRFPDLFQKAGVYKFVFSINESSCKNCDRRVIVKASSKIGKWGLLGAELSRPYSVRVGSCFPSFSIACYDIFDNRIPFTQTPDVMVKLKTRKGLPVDVGKMKKADLSSNSLTLKIKDILIESNHLDEIRPSYEATLVICSQDELFSVSIPCQVLPGAIHHVTAQPSILENRLLPGFVIKQFILEMFDAYGNHINKGLEVLLNLDGFCFQDQIGSKRKVDNHGCIDLGGLLKVTADYGKKVLLSVLSDNEVVFKQEFQIEKRELRVASTLPECCTAGSRLENIVFEVVDSDGNIDESIHDNEKCEQSHMLTIKSEVINSGDSIRYTFRNGRCTIPAIALPQSEGSFCFVAAHCRYAELHLSVKVPVMRAPIVESDEIQSPCSDGKVLLLQDSPSLKHVENLMVKGLEDEIFKYGSRIKRLEDTLNLVSDKKTEIEQALSTLQDSVKPHLLNYLSEKEEVLERIKSKGHSAAAVLCSLLAQEPQKHFMEDVVGVVALLGTVCSNKLSRILAEYLGEDQMLAVVCRSFASVDALEKYEQNGEVNCDLALHAEAAAHGKSINGRFHVLCLEDIRPYSGKFEGSDPQKKLDLPHPTLPTGNVPPGFIGYAVNMVNLDFHHLETRTAAGYGLRETLFYRLFGELQVYNTRKQMKEARAYIKHGAVSLDGGILRENGVISLGCCNPEICFPVVTSEADLHAFPESVEFLEKIREKKSELRVTIHYIGDLTTAHEKVMKKYNKRKEKFVKFMDDVEPMIKDYYLEYGSNAEKGSEIIP